MADSSQENTVNYCAYCGAELDSGARFCKNCGKNVRQAAQESWEAEKEKSHIYEEPVVGQATERKTTYEGYIHKCPNCGEVLEAFVTNCPSCSYEIRDSKSTSSVHEFAMKLERIEAQKMPTFEEKKSSMKMLIGRDLQKDDDAEKARSIFEDQKEEEKSNLIINFPVPNTKEDMLEFLLLASSNINVKHDADGAVTKAWISKLEQVYQRAEISMGNSPDFAQIRYLYEKKKKEIEKHKQKEKKLFVWIMLVMVVLFGLLGLMALLGIE